MQGLLKNTTDFNEEDKLLHFRATGAFDAAQDLSDIFNTFLHGDDIEDFDTRWDQALLAASEIPTKNVLEGLYKLKYEFLFGFRQYHAPGNKFERFRGVLELIGRFEFEFCRHEFFLRDSNFWCVYVNVPCPVCAHAIPFRMLWCP